MLGFSGTDTFRVVTRDTHAGAAPGRIELVSGDEGDDRSKPNRRNRFSQERRRLVGSLGLLTNIALDGFAIAAILLIWINVPNGHAKASAAVYALIALVLLLPTYRRGRVVPRPSEVLVPIATRIAIAPLITIMLTFLNGKNELKIVNMKVYAEVVICTVVAVALIRLIMFKAMSLLRNRGYDLEDTLIIGAGQTGVDVANALAANPESGLVPIGFLERFDEPGSTYPRLGNPEDLFEVLDETHLRHVVLAFGSASEPELVRYVRRSAHLPVKFYAVPRFFELGAANHAIGSEVDGFSLVPLRKSGRGHSAWAAKRAYDIVVGGIMTFFALPVLAVCAVAVKLSSPGPVFFKQIRVSLDGMPFEILKFRSMRVNDDSNTQWTVDDDDRVTKVGKFLRKSHLDELPQLFNVLRGDMSIVGPRPERPHFVSQFSEEIEGYSDRHRVPAGITGWAQVHGFWGDSSIEARVRLDNRYIENWSLWRDLVITLRTIPTFLGKRR
jgi:exopolysaccharide biosynthesis polyprenyl glycosylphosphotransferase